MRILYLLSKKIAENWKAITCQYNLLLQLTFFTSLHFELFLRGMAAFFCLLSLSLEDSRPYSSYSSTLLLSLRSLDIYKLVCCPVFYFLESVLLPASFINSESALCSLSCLTSFAESILVF